MSSVVSIFFFASMMSEIRESHGDAASSAFSSDPVLEEEEVPSSRSTDLGFAVLFAAHLVAFGLFAGWCLPGWDDPRWTATEEEYPALRTGFLASSLLWIWTRMYTLMLSRSVRWVLTLSWALVSHVLIAEGVAILFLGHGSLWGALLLVIGTSVVVAGIYLRTDFEASYEVMRFCAGISTDRRGGDILLTWIIQLLFVLYFWPWILLLSHVLLIRTGFLAVAFGLFLACSLYWTWQVLSGVLHVFCCSAFWTEVSEDPPEGSTSLIALRTVLFPRFGSICRGALMSTPLLFVAGLAARLLGWSAAGSDVPWCSCHRLAFAQLAAHPDRGYHLSVRGVYLLFSRRDFGRLLQEDMSGAIVTLVAILLFGCSSSALGLLTAYLLNPTIRPDLMGGLSVCCWAFSTLLTSLTLQPFEANICAFYILLAKSPSRVRKLAPELHAAFRQRYGSYERAMDAFEQP